LLYLRKFVLSRNKVHSVKKIRSAEKQTLMRKLNKKKIKWIVKGGSKEGARSLDNSKNSGNNAEMGKRTTKKIQGKEITLKKP